MKMRDLIPWRKTEVVSTAEQKMYWPADFFREDRQWFQKALDTTKTLDASSNTAVFGCVSILSQEVASLAPYHYRVDRTTGGREILTDTTVARTLRRPNDFQSSSDFWLYMMQGLLYTGGCYAAGRRNGRTEIDALYPLPPRGCHPRINHETGAVFYDTGNFGDGLFDVKSVIPAYNVLSVRMNCRRHPLIPETPIGAYVAAASTGNAIQRSVAKFFLNMGRPSGVLTTPKPLTKTQLDTLREHWNAVTKNDNAGGTPVLHSGLKWEQVTMSATDAEVINTYKLAVADIAMAYRIPHFMLGDLSKATFKNVESLMRVFYTSSLRFYLEHIENALNNLFELDGVTEYIEFDIESGLLRGDFEQRVNGYTKGVQGALFTPDEARIHFSLPKKPGGDQLLVQRQMVPLSKVGELLDAEAAAAAATPPTDDEPPDEPDEEEEEESVDDDEENRNLDLRLRTLEEDQPDSFADLMLKLGALVPATHAEQQRSVVNVPVTVIAPEQKAPVVNVTLPEQKAHVVNVEAPVINVATPEQRAPVVNVEAPVVNIAVPKQDAPIINVAAAEQRTPIVNVSVPEQAAPVVNVAVPKQNAPVVNVSVPEQRTPIVNVAVPKQDAPVVNVAVPSQEAPVVNVAVPSQEAPVVNVAAPMVNVAAAEVHIPEQPAPVVNVNLPEESDREQIVERDDEGEIKRVVRRKIPKEEK